MQATASKTTQAGSASLAFSAATNAGDVILIGFNFDQSVTPSSVTDSQGNVYTEVGTQLTTPGGVHGRVYYAKNIVGGPDTVTVNLSGQADFLEMYLTEYSGADPNNPIDAQAGGTGTTGAASSGNATTTASGDIVYGYCVSDAACTVGSGFTARSTLVENLTEDEIVGNAGSYAATGTSNSGWLMQMVALRPGSGTAGAAPAITSATAANGTVGTAFSYQIAATNSPTSYGATGLPAGLSVNTNTGLISGTPTAAGTSNVTLSAANSAGTGNATLTLTVATAPPVITSPSSASGTTGVGFTYQITATNSPTTYNASGLPDGLIVNTTNGLISGTPMASGISTVTVSATNGTGTGNASVTLTISLGPPVVTSSTSVSAAIGSAFSYQITATNSPTSYGATGLPTGLSVDTTTGIISGTPSAAGSSTVTISATNGTGTGTAPLDLTITATPYFVQATANKTTQTPSASLAFSADTKAGDVILIGFNFDQSVAPSSVTDSQGNVYSEVGTQLTTPGGVHGRVYYAKNIAGGPDTVTVNLDGQTDFLEMYLTEYSGADVNNPVDAQAGATGTAGAVSSGNATTTMSGDVVYGYCVADSACTAGSGFTARSTLVENLTEDEIVGNAGSYAATGTSNSGWLMQMVALRPGSGTVGAAPAITSSTAANGTVGTAFSYQIAATNSPTSYGATGLPAGLSVNTSTGLISGTPTAAGISNVTLSATNSAGTGNGTLTLTIANVAQAELSITPSSVAFGNVSVGSNSSKTVTLTNTGNATLNITAASISGAGYTMSLQPTSINAGANTTFTVTFTPTASGSASGNILITSNAPGSPATIVLSGAGVQAQISATPSSVAFGTVTVGNTNSQPITLKNNGNMTLTFSQISVTGAGFGQTGLSTSTTIAAGGSTAFNATFDPSSSGTLSGSITLTTNGTPSPLVINLSGTGQASSLLLGASPTSLAFGNVLDQSSKQMTTSVTNNGNANVTISGVTMVGVGFSASGIVNGTILTPGQSATLTVTFAPTSGGARSGSVGIASNATNSPATISLSGTGMHSVALTWSASPTGGVTYNVFRGTSPGSEGTTPINTAPITALTFTDANVTPGTTYYYTVEAVDGGGSSDPSNEASAAIPNP